MVERQTLKPEFVPRKRGLRLKMPEKLLTGTLNKTKANTLLGQTH